METGQDKDPQEKYKLKLLEIKRYLRESGGVGTPENIAFYYALLTQTFETQLQYFKSWGKRDGSTFFYEDQIHKITQRSDALEGLKLVAPITHTNWNAHYKVALLKIASVSTSYSETMPFVENSDLGLIAKSHNDIYRLINEVITESNATRD